MIFKLLGHHRQLITLSQRPAEPARGCNECRDIYKIRNFNSFYTSTYQQDEQLIAVNPVGKWASMG
jgi:hypothetical protein